jgi:hypothetical protein
MGGTHPLGLSDRIFSVSSWPTRLGENPKRTNQKEDAGMQVGDRIKFPFGGEEKEGVVVKIFPKKVYLNVDFPRHKGKLIVRSLAALEGEIPRRKKKEKVKKEKKAKASPSKEKKSEENKGEEEKK